MIKKYECCGNCRYWKTVFDYKLGICHRNPPTEEGYPSTGPDGSCGEFRDLVWIYRKPGTHEDRLKENPRPL